MSNTQRIICICSGNICRSPMAVALLRPKLAHRGVSAIVISGGTLGIQGRRADAFARQAMAEWSDELAATINEHRSQGISSAMLEMADHLVVMAPRHEKFVSQRVGPRSKRRIVALWRHAPEGISLTKIPDPVGHDAEVFRHCRDLIDQCLDQWLTKAFGPTPVE